MEAHLSTIDLDKGYIVSSKFAPVHKIGISGRKHFYLLQIINYEGKKLFYMRNPCPNFDFRGGYRVIPEDLAFELKRCTGEVMIYEGNFVLD